MDNLYVMKGSFSVAVPDDVAWAVLADYASHPRFVTDLKSSVVKARKAGEVIVAQEAVGRVALFSITVQLVLQIRETPTQITFADTLRIDFEFFEGEWTLSHTGNKLHVAYAMRCQPRAQAPRFIMGPLLDDSTQRLMVQMRMEIEKRARLVVARR